MRERVNGQDIAESFAGPMGPLFCRSLTQDKWHLTVMHPNTDHFLEYSLRIPAGPEPFPVQEPPDPPENPDMPVREPDPEDPGQI